MITWQRSIRNANASGKIVFVDLPCNYVLLFLKENFYFLISWLNMQKTIFIDSDFMNTFQIANCNTQIMVWVMVSIEWLWPNLKYEYTTQGHNE